MSVKPITEYTMKDLTPEFMKQYIDEKDPSYKEEFKKVAIIVDKNEKRRFNSANARYAFCNHFEEFKHLLPQKKPKKKTATQLYEEW